MPWLSPLNTTLSMLLFVLGLYCLLTQRTVIKQVIGLKIMLQGVTLGLIHAGHLASLRRGATIEARSNALRLAEAMVISALIVEAVVIALALAMIVNVYRHYPSGDIDRLDTLQG
jgi:multisubunit Na+/H+ antiporter MnhC subunit